MNNFAANGSGSFGFASNAPGSAIMQGSCNPSGSEAFLGTPNANDWIQLTNSTASTENLISKIAALSFEEARPLWASNGSPNIVQQSDGTCLPTSMPWEILSASPSTQPIDVQRGGRDRNSAGSFIGPPGGNFLLNNLSNNLGEGGLLMSPSSKDMAALGMQMVDQVLSNSPGNGNFSNRDVIEGVIAGALGNNGNLTPGISNILPTSNSSGSGFPFNIMPTSQTPLQHPNQFSGGTGGAGFMQHTFPQTNQRTNHFYVQQSQAQLLSGPSLSQLPHSGSGMNDFNLVGNSGRYSSVDGDINQMRHIAVSSSGSETPSAVIPTPSSNAPFVDPAILSAAYSGLPSSLVGGDVFRPGSQPSTFQPSSVHQQTQHSGFNFGQSATGFPLSSNVSLTTADFSALVPSNDDLHSAATGSGFVSSVSEPGSGFPPNAYPNPAHQTHNNLSMSFAPPTLVSGSGGSSRLTGLFGPSVHNQDPESIQVAALLSNGESGDMIGPPPCSITGLYISDHFLSTSKAGSAASLADLSSIRPTAPTDGAPDFSSGYSISQSGISPFGTAQLDITAGHQSMSNGPFGRGKSPHNLPGGSLNPSQQQPGGAYAMANPDLYNPPLAPTGQMSGSNHFDSIVNANSLNRQHIPTSTPIANDFLASNNMASPVSAGQHLMASNPSLLTHGGLYQTPAPDSPGDPHSQQHQQATLFAQSMQHLLATAAALNGTGSTQQQQQSQQQAQSALQQDSVGHRSGSATAADVFASLQAAAAAAAASGGSGAPGSAFLVPQHPGSDVSLSNSAAAAANMPPPGLAGHSGLPLQHAHPQ
ncbi:unnamed protein product, partial [Protopolystoma xenopodis]